MQKKMDPEPEQSSSTREKAVHDFAHRRQLKAEDALAYLEQVKSHFKDLGRPAVYNSFVGIMKQFKAHNIGTAEVHKQVLELFSGHDELLVGFQAFLPPGFLVEEGEKDKGISSLGGFSKLSIQGK